MPGCFSMLNSFLQTKTKQQITGKKDWNYLQPNGLFLFLSNMQNKSLLSLYGVYLCLNSLTGLIQSSFPLFQLPRSPNDMGVRQRLLRTSILYKQHTFWPTTPFWHAPHRKVNFEVSVNFLFLQHEDYRVMRSRDEKCM